MKASQKSISLLALILSVLIANPAVATDWEITPYIGYTFSNDIGSPDGGDISVSDDVNIGLALAWQDTPNGQGQILINYVGHEFDSAVDGTSQSFDILYTHFSGVAQFRQNNYITTVSLGAGGAYFDTDQDSSLYPSVTVALGSRYEFSKEFAMFTEIRGYGTLTDNDDDLFCTNDVCVADFDDSVFIDATISFGFAFKF